MSSSQTMMSPGKTAQPPQPIGSCQPTNVSPLTEAGAAVPAHHTGSLEASTPALSRTTPSVTSAVTLRFIMRMVRMSPKMPAEVTPIGIGHGDAAGRHFLDGAPRRDRFRPACQRREVLAHRREAQRERRAYQAPAAGNERLRPVHPATADAFFQQHGGDGCGGDRAQRVVKGRTHGTPLWETSLANLRASVQTGAMPRRASRRRSQATNGIDNATIHALPTIWPSRKSSEPKASHRNTTESTRSPTTPDATTAMRSPRRASGV